MVHNSLSVPRSVTRFAPSPTGALHLGHVAAALWARRRGERLLVRLEDIDATRCRPVYAEWIQQDLDWLGLAGEGPVRRQSRHMGEYAAALQRLRAAGLLYPCFCTRTDIAREIAAIGAAPHGPDGAALYPGTCRALPEQERRQRLAAGLPHAWRLDIAAATSRVVRLDWYEAGQGRVAADPLAFGDVVLGRKDVPASYHLCVTHDDALQGVTLVTRAEDLKPATGLHRLLQTLLGWPEPAYAHHPLLRDGRGVRLSKRTGAPAIRDLRAAGLSPADVLALLPPPFR